MRESGEIEFVGGSMNEYKLRMIVAVRLSRLDQKKLIESLRSQEEIRMKSWKLNGPNALATLFLQTSIDLERVEGHAPPRQQSVFCRDIFLFQDPTSPYSVFQDDILSTMKEETSGSSGTFTADLGQRQTHERKCVLVELEVTSIATETFCEIDAQSYTD
ncbi:hypothetical protein J3R30DRAFT_3400306 [Lentinula aciculospora]|uniref:Uncharacterized protein n=1 Tax=Lentinula aciculospora TaxID=153920 RepID=A0A9W9ARN3_9AGAR|nr:hypothetical protein J3R30DRAFT_3400306 [Lentinula aciculospora]